MSFLQILDTLLLGPLKLIFEVIFQIANRFIGHPGLAIIVLSLIMNVLVLPLYKQADAMQERSRDIEAKLKRGADHIKKSFSGDERMMILQTYYRQNNYKPTQALNGSVSLLLEIPFFMAAYQFLSHLGALSGVSLGPIADLSKPDGMLVVGGLAINVLPVLMTAVNVISSAIYLKGFPLKTKIQLYGMAGFFLVFLYTSPSGLVFYWTLNNLFSLVKTIFYKLKNPRRVLSVLLSILGLGLLALGIGKDWSSVRKMAFLIGAGVALQLPLVWMLVGSKLPKGKQKPEVKPNKGMFVLGCVFLTVLVGMLIPSAFLAASPQEYVDILHFYDPIWYLVSATCLAAGTFLVWLGVFYWLANPKGKVLFGRLVWVLSGIMLVDYMFFGTKLGVINSNLQYIGAFHFSGKEQLLNLVVLAAVAAVLYFVACKFQKAVVPVLLTAAIALGGMSGLNISTVRTAVEDVLSRKDSYVKDTVSIPLSKTGKNVIVLMLDRALGFHIPYIFNEKPQLKEQFDGFVHYSNTLSFGGYTNIAVPALFGGYEYTPVEMNRRDSELLMEKHNEALKMMPKLFSEHDYKVTIIDPPYADYKWIPELSVFDDIEGANAYIAKGTFEGKQEGETFSAESNLRNFFCFSIMKTMPLVVQPTIYDGGRYNQAPKPGGAALTTVYTGQTRHSSTTAEGLTEEFMKPYKVLEALSSITTVTEEKVNTFLSMTNDTTHDPMLLQTPDYVPAEIVDNTQYEAENSDRFTLDGKLLKTYTDQQVVHYHTNMATMLRLGEWFDYLREQGVYDNTRIILVADHGRVLAQMDGVLLGDGTDIRHDIEFYTPLLMVKDFDSEGFTTSTEFMTNADVPTLAVTDLIENPVNPYTGKVISNAEKTAHPQYVLMSTVFDVAVNNGKTYLPDWWAVVEDNVWDLNNWTLIEKDLVLKDYAIDE